MKMRAIVFARRTGAKGLGHVGWAFDCADGTFSAGSVENPLHSLITRPRDTGFWSIRTHDPIRPMRKRHYTEFKVIPLSEANIARAWRTAAWISHRPYDVVGHNCMNATYDVLRAYGLADLPVPAHHWEPNGWFDSVGGEHYRIDDDDVSLESAGRHAHPIDLTLPDVESLLTDMPDAIAPEMPTWRTAHSPEWQEFESAMASAKSHTSTHHAPEAIATRLLHLLGRFRPHL